MSTDEIRSLVVNSFGAALIGSFVASMLYGLTTLQTYLYFLNYPKDNVLIKTLVSIVWLLDSIHIALVSYCVYYYLVLNYSNPAALATTHWSLNISLIMNLIIAVLAQCFFTRQVYTLCRGILRWCLTSILTVTVVGHFCFGVETAAYLFIKPQFTDFNNSGAVRLAAATPFAVFAILSDIFIAISLCCLLYESRTGLGRTNMLITTLILYAVNRCLLTSAVAIAEVIVFILHPKSLWFLAIDFVVGKLYANSLLASLNSRKSLREGPVDTSFRSTSLRIATSTILGSSSRERSTNREQAIALEELRGHANSTSMTESESVKARGVAATRDFEEV